MSYRLCPFILFCLSVKALKHGKHKEGTTRPDSSNTEKGDEALKRAKSKFTCQLCSKVFSRRDNYQRHLVTHSGERPYGCQQCGQSFAFLHKLVTHTRTHSSQRPFQCGRCGKCFIDTASLDQHACARTPPPLEPKHTCGVCGKSFISSSQLILHSRFHFAKGERLQTDVLPGNSSLKTNEHSHLSNECLLFNQSGQSSVVTRSRAESLVNRVLRSSSSEDKKMETLEDPGNCRLGSRSLRYNKRKKCYESESGRKSREGESEKICQSDLERNINYGSEDETETTSSPSSSVIKRTTASTTADDQIAQEVTDGDRDGYSRGRAGVRDDECNSSPQHDDKANHLNQDIPMNGRGGNDKDNSLMGPVSDMDKHSISKCSTQRDSDNQLILSQDIPMNCKGGDKDNPLLGPFSDKDKHTKGSIHHDRNKLSKAPAPDQAETLPQANSQAHSQAHPQALSQALSQAHPHGCEFCGVRFQFESHLRQHLQRHTGLKAFRCPQCPMACSSHVTLMIHQRRHRAKASTFPCQHCGKVSVCLCVCEGGRER